MKLKNLALIIAAIILLIIGSFATFIGAETLMDYSSNSSSIFCTLFGSLMILASLLAALKVKTNIHDYPF